jgi:hypothetical protein
MDRDRAAIMITNLFRKYIKQKKSEIYSSMRKSLTLKKSFTSDNIVSKIIVRKYLIFYHNRKRVQFKGGIIYKGRNLKDIHHQGLIIKIRILVIITPRSAKT